MVFSLESFFAKIVYEYLVSKKLSQAGIEPAT